MQMAKEYKAMDIRMYFVLDEETPKLSAEQKVHQDIVFAHADVTPPVGQSQPVDFIHFYHVNLRCLAINLQTSRKEF